MFVTLSRLGSMLAGVAEPLLSETPAKSTVDKTVKEAEGQVDPTTRDAEAGSPLTEVSAVVSTGQVVRMNATPAVHWDGAASAWICAGDTSVVVAFADGAEQTYEYSEGTAIPVAAGMIHFPRCDEH